MKQVRLFDLKDQAEAFAFYQAHPSEDVHIALDDDWMNYIVYWYEEDVIQENE